MRILRTLSTLLGLVPSARTLASHEIAKRCRRLLSARMPLERVWLAPKLRSRNGLKPMLARFLHLGRRLATARLPPKSSGCSLPTAPPCRSSCLVAPRVPLPGSRTAAASSRRAGEKSRASHRPALESNTDEGISRRVRPPTSASARGVSLTWLATFGDRRSGFATGRKRRQAPASSVGARQFWCYRGRTRTLRPPYGCRRRHVSFTPQAWRARKANAA